MLYLDFDKRPPSGGLFLSFFPEPDDHAAWFPVVPGVVGDGLEIDCPAKFGLRGVEGGIVLRGLFQGGFAVKRRYAAQEVGFELGFDLAILWQHELVEVVGRVVAGLKAVDDGASLKGDAAHKFLGSLVGVDSLNRHVHGEVNFVAFAPVPLYDEVAFHHGCAEFLSVDGQVVVAAPVRVAEGYFEFALLFRVHADHYFAVPGVIGLLADLDFILFQMNFRFASDEEVKEDGVFFLSVDVAADRGHEAGLVRGAAGAAEPLPSVKVGMLMPFAHVVPGFAGLGVESQKLVIVEERFSV